MGGALVLRAVVFTFSGIVLWVGLHAAVTVHFGMNAQPRPSDVAVVLGTRVLPSGVPSYWLRGRLERAYSLYAAGTIKYIIVSGGFGREGHEEAEVMREYLIGRGVPAERIFTDLNGDDTFETARHTKQIMDREGFHSVVIVSHYYHLARAVVAFRRFEIPDVSALGVVTNPLWVDGGNLLREFAAFYFYLVRDYAPS
jgi:vancomycin permeability regulator SanA